MSDPDDTASREGGADEQAPSRLIPARAPRHLAVAALVAALLYLAYRCIPS